LAYFLKAGVGFGFNFDDVSRTFVENEELGDIGNFGFYGRDAFN